MQEMLVKFIVVDNKRQIADNYEYINAIYTKINLGGLIKSVNIDPEADAFGCGPIIELDDEGNVFLLEFNSKEEQKSNIWSIYFVYGTYNDSKQLEISIYSDTYKPEVSEGYLEKLKVKIKNSIKRDWSKVIWLVDKDSECLSICLYSQIYKVENLMREIINEVMTKQYGTSWWKSFVPDNIREKHSSRFKEYKAKVQSFADVDEKLMSIDIDDLGKLIKLQRFKWNPTFNDKINAFLSGGKKYNDTIVREELKKQTNVEIDLWEEHFSKYLPEDFNNRYETFTKDRNHIMHNKLIDRLAFKTMKATIDQIEEDLIKAIESVRNQILSNEEKVEIEKQKLIEKKMLEELDHECRENDAGVSIKYASEIEELFRDSMDLISTGVEEILRFRNDLDITVNYARDGYSGKMFSIISRIDETGFEFTYDMMIDSSEGAESTLEISCGNEIFCTTIQYQNGAVEYDDDSGLYMPITEDEISDIDSVIDDIVKFINQELPSYLQNANSEDIVEYLECCECGMEAICINENILPIGTCMNCGYLNEIHECERCHFWFNSNEVGEVLDDISFCQNCIDRMEEE